MAAETPSSDSGAPLEQQTMPAEHPINDLEPLASIIARLLPEIARAHEAHIRAERS
jgi:hypothetical protein